MSSLDHAQTLSSQNARWFRPNDGRVLLFCFGSRRSRNERNEQIDVRINEHFREISDLASHD
jgi:hypothetical protein